ncbi:MAG: hypothetical protein WD894_00835 [Pirellulales bacterium]
MPAGQIELVIDAPFNSNGAVSIVEVEQSIQQRGATALRWLLEAHTYAVSLSHDVWQFALGITSLGQGGLSLNDIRWLLYRRLVQHGMETTQPGEDRRTFRAGGAVRFDRRSCFVLTEAGMAFAREASSTPVIDQPLVSATNDAPQAVIVPTWDRDRQELRLGKELVKCFKTPAPNQELILAAFEEEGWPVHIYDPLPPHPEQDPRRRLHDTINSLNRNQKKPLVRFMGDGSGQGVRWDLNRGGL